VSESDEPGHGGPGGGGHDGPGGGGDGDHQSTSVPSTTNPDGGSGHDGGGGEHRWPGVGDDGIFDGHLDGNDGEFGAGPNQG